MKRKDDQFLEKAMIWFTGVVEDVNDPEQLGRVRVRCFGYHTEDLGKIATDSLPWATVLGPTNSAAISGIGTGPHAMIPGTWVVGFFRDGGSAQDPIVLGTIGSSYADKPNTNIGFSDVSGTYPKLQGEEETYIDNNLLSRGTNTITRELDTVSGEPASQYAAVYPNNKVTQTTSGHIIEIDDTPDAERIKVFHKSGTFVEIHPNGDVVQNNSNKYQITTGNDNVHITGTCNIFVDGTTNITCPTTNITGNVNITGNLTISGNSTAAGDHISAGISGNSHTHTDTPGLGAGTTSGPK